MTVQQAALLLLRRSGIYSLDPTVEEASLNRRGVVTGDLDDLVLCLNGAAQESIVRGPSTLTQRERGVILKAPVTTTVTATKYSTVVTVVGINSEMTGCTIRISGDTRDNRIMQGGTLLFPYLGTTGTGIAATVYFDATLLNSLYSDILDPISTGDGELNRVGDLETFLALSGGFGRRPTGDPCHAFVQQEFDTVNSSGVLTYLRVSPMPERDTAIGFIALRTAPEWTTFDIYDGELYTNDPGTTIPLDLIEMGFIPIALQRWTEHPSYAGSSVQLQETARQHKLALDARNQRGQQTGSVKGRFL